MSKYAIELENVHKYFGSIRALDGLSIQIPDGVISGLVGPNGAGKTTAYAVIAGFLKPKSGKIDVLGRGSFSPRKHRGKFSILPQDCELSPHVGVKSLLVHFARLQGLSKRDAKKDADRVLDEVGLRDRSKMRLRQLSHGMRRRIAVAQALIGSPKLILLDEPTSGLDPKLVVQLRDVFLAQKGKATLMISSHVLSELEQTCDHIVFMHKGRATRQGSIKEITNTGSLIRYKLLSSPPRDALIAKLPQAKLSWENNQLTVVTDSDLSIHQVNAKILPILLEHNIGIEEVRAGQSLEETFMADHKTT